MDQENTDVGIQNEVVKEKELLTVEEMRNLFKANPDLRNRLGFIIGMNTKIDGRAIEKFLDGKSDVFPFDLETALKTTQLELTEQLGNESSIDRDFTQLRGLTDQYRHLFEGHDSEVYGSEANVLELQNFLFQLRNLAINTQHLGAFFDKYGFGFQEAAGYLDQVSHNLVQHMTQSSSEEASSPFEHQYMSTVRADWEMVVEPANQQHFSLERKQTAQQLSDLITETNLVDSVEKLAQAAREAARAAASLDVSQRSDT